MNIIVNFYLFRIILQLEKDVSAMLWRYGRTDFKTHLEHFVDLMFIYLVKIFHLIDKK